MSINSNNNKINLLGFDVKKIMLVFYENMVSKNQQKFYKIILKKVFKFGRSFNTDNHKKLQICSVTNLLT